LLFNFGFIIRLFTLSMCVLLVHSFLFVCILKSTLCARHANTEFDFNNASYANFTSTEWVVSIVKFIRAWVAIIVAFLLGRIWFCTIHFNTLHMEENSNNREMNIWTGGLVKYHGFHVTNL